MAKGTQLKEEITQKILNTFPGSFKFNKELRIPGVEGGEQLQIKVSLTCAKENVESEDTMISFIATDNDGEEIMNKPIEPSADEKKRVEDLIAKLGLA